MDRSTLNGDDKSGNDAPNGDNKSTTNDWFEDIQCLSNLSEPEIDFLVSLKELAIRRAKNAGHKDLGDKFDLRMLCGLGFVLLEFFKERVQCTCKAPDSDEMLRLLNKCGLSFLKSEESSESKSSVEAKNDMSSVLPQRKQLWDGLCEDTAKHYKKRRTRDSDT